MSVKRRNSWKITSRFREKLSCSNNSLDHMLSIAVDPANAALIKIWTIILFILNDRCVIGLHHIYKFIVTIRDHPSKDVRSKREGGCRPKVDDLGPVGGSAIIRTSRKNIFWPETKKNWTEFFVLWLEKTFFGCFGSIRVRHPLPPNIFLSRLQYILRFGRFYAQYGPDVQDGGGRLPKRTMLDRGGP